MVKKLIEMLVGSLEQKKRYRRYKERTQELPADYRTAIEALERYLMLFGPGDDAESLLSMMEDLADLFEENAANGTPLRSVVGEQPVEFTEAFLRNYPQGQWISKERERLIEAIGVAAGRDA